MSQTKGFSRERELVNLFDEAGFGVTRVPKSGGGTKRELPDILAGKDGRIFAIEAKARKDNCIYLKGGEAESLCRFALRFGAKTRIGVRFDYEDWFFFHPGDLHMTDGGNHRVTRETAIENGTSFDKLIENPLSPIDEWVIQGSSALSIPCDTLLEALYEANIVTDV